MQKGIDLPHTSVSGVSNGVTFSVPAGKIRGGSREAEEDVSSVIIYFHLTFLVLLNIKSVNIH